MIQRIAIVGAGNVAWHLAHALNGGQTEVVQVYSRTIENAQGLARAVDANPLSDISGIKDVDLVLVAISDDQTAEVCDSIAPNLLVAHTSGMTHLESIKRERKGAFYPLQTMSRNKEVDFTQVPLCLEAEKEEDLKLLEELAGKISNSVQVVESDQRQVLHLAAVFASNFVNHLYTSSQRIVENAGLNFNLLKPLILEVAEKVQTLDPADAQTGPARRQDIETLNRHLDLLLEDPQNHELYHVLTDRIMRDYNGE